MIVPLDGTSLTIGNPWFCQSRQEMLTGYIAPMGSGGTILSAFPAQK
ncbi:hypothetical protein CWATWH0005_4084 [Crocosphaera watsonii WH 0005]|uniref:Uncharacterized protein n=1 Tax=Crocosphaera watsonii WH 0005 TaxID=423472 RepID=T2INR3_CROWT|nr:hypothetical protein CWATWH0005_4084 [Crocosphaera watsonii WH 0005]